MAVSDQARVNQSIPGQQETLPGCRIRAANAFWLPCYPETGGNAPHSALFIDQNLATGSMEFARLMAETGRTIFRAAGTCMYPALKPGDRLHICPKDVDQIRVGEITVFARSGSFFAHRAIEVGRDERGPFVVTRPDNSREGSDGAFYQDQVVGVVSSIERHEKHMLAPEPASAFTRALSVPARKLIEIRQTAANELSKWAAAGTNTTVYRLAAHTWWRWSRPDVSFELHAPLRSNPSSPFIEKISGPKLEQFFLSPTNSASRWSLILLVNGRQAAFIVFQRVPQEYPCSGWWAEAVKNRMRYQGLDLERRLFQKASEILTRSGIAQVCINEKLLLSSIVRQSRAAPFIENTRSCPVKAKQIPLSN